jgi:large subunit ribosomal protein L15
MKLSELYPASGAKHPKKRVGRGPASGTGKTAGRGFKGQRSRAGGGVRPGFEGGQMPLIRRMPKRGFKNIFGQDFLVVNVRDLNRFAPESLVDEAALRQAGLVKGASQGIKLLGQGEITQPLTVKVNAVSAQARAKVEAAGGTVEVI